MKLKVATVQMTTDDRDTPRVADKVLNRVDYDAPRDEIDRMFIVTQRKK